MKTDLKRTKKLLDSLGIDYGIVETRIANIDNELIGIELLFGKNAHYPDEYPDCDNVDGYSGFYTKFKFDENGNFLTVGAWE